MSTLTHDGKMGGTQSMVSRHCDHLTSLPRSTRSPEDDFLDCPNHFDISRNVGTERKIYPRDLTSRTDNKLDLESPEPFPPSSPSQIKQLILSSPPGSPSSGRATRTPRLAAVPFFPGPIHELFPSRWYDDDDDGDVLSSNQDVEGVDFNASCETSFTSVEDTSFSSLGFGHSMGGAGDESYSDEYDSANTSLSLSSLGGCGAGPVAGLKGEKVLRTHKELVGLGIFGLDEDLALRLSSLGIPYTQNLFADSASSKDSENPHLKNDNGVAVEQEDGENANLDPDIAMPYYSLSSFSGHILTSIPECDFEFEDDSPEADSSGLGGSDEYSSDALYRLRESVSNNDLEEKAY
ncbi:hypothetical protein EST38_g9249 [Candolleomyces aberdarensis]|uniref:Uncharacterized protein n=1 Tax=Candolleomyces aberdarensis TaxID=2316362 RepID=A0A4V1Q2X4_9AGAR|nr:hypothetical protein EST38_g9249 [Candolleomyces aberdarensis]